MISMKRIVSIFLTLVMLVSVVGTLPAAAADGGNDASANDETQFVAEVYEADGSLEGRYKSVSMAMVCACENTGNRKVKLLADSIEDTPVNVTGGSATLDLNGHKLKRDRENNMSDKIGSVIMLGESANLKIIDSSDAKSGTIEGGGAKWGGGIYMPKDNIVTMNAGTITHCTAYYGGGVYVDDSSKFIMNGGKISNCYATYGGGVYVEDKATVETHGGQITNNIAEDDGGGIYIWDAKAELNNCYVAKNHADDGGAIYSDYKMSDEYSTLTINSSSIVKNTAQDCYGGIYSKGGLSLQERTTVSGNSNNGKYGGGVYSKNKAITLSGLVWVYGNLTNTVEPCDVNFGESVDQAFGLNGELSDGSFIGVYTRYNSPKTWYSDDHISYGGCSNEEHEKMLKNFESCLFSNGANQEFYHTYEDRRVDISTSLLKHRHLMQILNSDKQYDRSTVNVTRVVYNGIELPQKDYSASYNSESRTVTLYACDYLTDTWNLDVYTDTVGFLNGATYASSDSGKYGLVVKNIYDSPTYTVSVYDGKVDGIEPDSGISSAKKKFFDKMSIEPVVPEGKAFSHWEVEGDYTTSYIPKYNQYTKIINNMTMPNGNVTFRAVFKNKVKTVDIKMFSPVVGKRTPFYTKNLDYPCLKATAIYKAEDGTELYKGQTDVNWQKRQEMFDGTAIHYFDYYANYLANLQVQDTPDGDFCLADSGDLTINVYLDNEILKEFWYKCDTSYEYVYGDGYDWRTSNNDYQPVKQHILHVTYNHTSEKAPIRKSIPSQILVPENMSKAELIEKLPTSVNVQIADISYSNGGEQAEVTQSPVKWITDNMPEKVTERFVIKGTYSTGNRGFEVKPGDDIYPTLVVVPNTQAVSQMPQITTASGDPVAAIDGTAKIGYGKKIKLTTSMEGAAIYYKLDNGQFTQYTPDAEIELSGEKDAITTHEIEAYAQNNEEKSETLKLTIEVDNKTKYKLNILDSDGSEYIYATGGGEYKLGEIVHLDMTKKYMLNPWKPGYVYENVENPRKTALTWSSNGILLNDEQKNNTAFDLEMPNSNVTIKIESFKYKDKVHDVTIVDQDGKTYEYALGAGQYTEGETVTIDSTQFMLKGMNDDGVATSEKTEAIEKVVSQWSAEGIELTDAQKKASKFEFEMPYNDVVIKAEAFRPLVSKLYLSSIYPVAGKALPDKLEILSATDVNGNEIDKKDIWLEPKLPTDSGFNGMWVDRDTNETVAHGTIAGVDKRYWTFCSVDLKVSGEKAAVKEYEIFMDGEKIPSYGMITINAIAKNDGLLAVDWGGDKELFYSKDDAKASLPKKVKVRTKYGTIDTAEVTWNGAEKLDSADDYGEFPITATLTLPEYVEDPNNIGTESFTIKIRKHIDSVALSADGVQSFPTRKGFTLPKVEYIKMDRNTNTDAYIIESKVQNKDGKDVSGDTAQAGEEYSIKVSISPTENHAVLSDNTVFTINGYAMKVIGKSENKDYSGRIVYDVEYTFTVEDEKSYGVIVNGTSIGKKKNGNEVGISVTDDAGFERWTAEAVYTTKETVTEGESGTPKEIEVEHRSPVNPFKGGAEYIANTSFVMPLLVDDSAKLELTANYSRGVTAFDRKQKEATIFADKDYNNAKVIFAAYDEWENLVAADWVAVDLKAGKNIIAVPESLAISDDEKIRIMVWDNLDDMTPLFDVFEQRAQVKSEDQNTAGDTENIASAK